MKKALLATQLILSLTVVVHAQSAFSPTTRLKPKPPASLLGLRGLLLDEKKNLSIRDTPDKWR